LYDYAVNHTMLVWCVFGEKSEEQDKNIVLLGG
jgi:hypothetical protein